MFVKVRGGGAVVHMKKISNLTKKNLRREGSASKTFFNFFMFFLRKSHKKSENRLGGVQYGQNSLSFPFLYHSIIAIWVIIRIPRRSGLTGFKADVSASRERYSGHCNVRIFNENKID